MTLALTAIALVVVLLGGYAWGHARARRIQLQLTANRERAAGVAGAVSAGERTSESALATARESTAASDPVLPAAPDPLALERARIVRSLERECAELRAQLTTAQGDMAHLHELAADRHALFGALAEARAETARYRQLVLDIENTAPPPLLGGRGTPDDLKLIVGIGPVLERMLHQLGITTYRQIGRWSERDIDDFDARLPEFPGRIRRDGWVTQARALHQSVYGEALIRERG